MLFGAVIVLALLAAGLLASFFHLGHPERAWRSAAKWRTSWLAREVIVLPAFMAAVFAWGAAHWLGWPTLALAAAGTLLALALYLCTAMIYACLPFLQEWHSPLTVVNYLVLGCASGFTLAATYSSWMASELTAALTAGALSWTVLGFATRAASLARNARLKARSSLQSAIGVKHPRIVQKAQGAIAGSFNTREFFHGRGPGSPAIGEVAVSGRRLRFACGASHWRIPEPCLYRSIRRLDGRALVLLRAGESSAESLLPGGVVIYCPGACPRGACWYINEY